MQVQQPVIQALLHIQAHLDSDLSLDSVASDVGVSPFHFHRLFQDTVGETLKSYTQRLRLERAALHMLLHDATVLDIALANGYQTHETFTRAFKRQFGMTPSQYRKAHPSLRTDDGKNEIARKQQEVINRYAGIYQLSTVRTVKLRPIPVVFLRSYGPYDKVDPSLYDDLVAWASARGLIDTDPLLLGMANDPPGITPEDRLRFDCCLMMRDPIRPEPPFGYQEIPGGHYAFASYVGPFDMTMEAAYVEITKAVMAMRRVELLGVPSIEMYQTTHIDTSKRLHHTDIYMPVQLLDNHH